MQHNEHKKLTQLFFLMIQDKPARLNQRGLKYIQSEAGGNIVSDTVVVTSIDSNGEIHCKHANTGGVSWAFRYNDFQ